tara:strand:+ start:266 stop:553 length:288 start_codon:yes stop_codon:yes gene_type:complete
MIERIKTKHRALKLSQGKARTNKYIDKLILDTDLWYGMYAVADLSTVPWTKNQTKKLKINARGNINLNINLNNGKKKSTCLRPTKIDRDTITDGT